LRHEVHHSSDQRVSSGVATSLAIDTETLTILVHLLPGVATPTRVKAVRVWTHARSERRDPWGSPKEFSASPPGQGWSS